MVNKFNMILVFLFLVTVIHGCHKSTEPVIPDEKPNFGLYYLQDTTVKIYNILDKDLNSLELQHTPVISDKDIEFYDYSTHCIYLKKDKYVFFPYCQDGVFPRSYADRPFVVVGNNKKCYAGYIQSELYITDFWHAPDIDYISMKMYPKDILYINWAFVFTRDRRDNETVKESLINLNLYHAGISVEITGIKIYQADTSTIEYSIKITNNDKDNLYVLDPDKVGTGIFHYYNNGPYVLDTNLSIMYQSTYKNFIRPNGAWRSEWFTKIESNNFIDRTIILKGYPYIPEGVYFCQLSYCGPSTNMEKDIRILPDDRYSIGEVLSGVVIANFHNSEKCKIKKYVGKEINIMLDKEKIKSFSRSRIVRY